MSISPKDKETLRKLGWQYMEIALLPVHREKLELWKALNRCRMQRPMVSIDQVPWNEICDEELVCQVEDPSLCISNWNLEEKFICGSTFLRIWF